MTGSSTCTGLGDEVPPDREEGVDLDDLLDDLLQVYHTPPYDISERAYLELCLTVAERLDGDEGPLNTPALYSSLSEHTRSEVDPSEGGIGVTNVADAYSTLTVERRMYKSTLYSAGYATIHAYDALQYFAEDDPAEVAKAIDLLDETGEIELLEDLFFAASTDAGTPGRPHKATDQDTTDQDTTERQPPADTQEEATAIESVTRSDGGESGNVVKSALYVSHDRFNGVSPVLAGWSSGGTRASCRPSRAEIKARVDLLPQRQIEALLNRTPNAECPRIDIPTELYERIVEWRPVLGESEPLAAIHQLNLMAHGRDDDWYKEGDCVGGLIPYEAIFHAFGMAPNTAYHRGLNGAMLLELYRRKVDSSFGWSGWNETEGKARVINAHSIPQDIIQDAKEVMLGPEDYDDWTYLISGKRRATSRNWTSDLREERRQLIEENEPVIDPPTVTGRIQEYLNSLPQQYFGHGAHGNLRPSKLDDAIWTVADTIDEEQRRNQELRKLYWMRKFPQPLYMPCDRFPRLRADYANQLMNLPSEVLRATYIDRDYELDLSKAHLASYVPVAKREGIEVPVLERHLEANMDADTSLLTEGDLWCDLASCLDVEGPMDKKRKTVKRAYSIVYGKEIRGLWYQLLKEWGNLTGEYLDSTEPFKGLRDHPLMDELLTTRDKLEAIITNRGGLEDANGRFIPLDAWDETKKTANRWRGVMAYVNASYEQELMGAAFDVADGERDRDEDTRFKIWAYQADGVTARINRRYSHSKQIERLQNAVKERADELGVPTELEVDYTKS